MHLGRHVDQPQPDLPLGVGLAVGQEPGVGVERQADRLPARLLRDDRVLAAGGHADPDGVVEVGGQAGERGDQAAGAAACGAPALAVAAERDRAAVAQQHDGQGERAGHGPILPDPGPSTRQGSVQGPNQPARSPTRATAPASLRNRTSPEVPSCTTTASAAVCPRPRLRLETTGTAGVPDG